ncbi:MAG: hypothetical protein FJX76_00835 [Armatimonadetes bacterium]|nr:hypothetical protein [Armatimonadota bacterium]
MSWVSLTSPLGVKPQPVPRAALTSAPQAIASRDAVSLSAAALATAPLSLPAGAPPAVPAAGAVPAATALRVLTDLESKGCRLTRKRLFWIPGLMSRRVKVTPDEFLKQLNEGSNRLEVAAGSFKPAAVRDSEDVAALDLLYLGGTPGAISNAPVLAALHALYLDGYAFSRGNTAIGPYGAWRGLRDGDAKGVARKHGEHDVPLAAPEDAYRAEFFRLGIVNPAFASGAEAQTLKALDARQAVFWKKPEAGARQDAEATHKRLFGGQTSWMPSSTPSTDVWLGTREAPLIRMDAARLADSASCQNEFDAAMLDYSSLLACGIPKAAGHAAWEAVKAPVAGEPFRDRVQAMRGIFAAEFNEADDAIASFEFLRKHMAPGQSLSDAAKQFVEVRDALGRNGQTVARDTYLRLRDHLDKAVPGPEPAADRRGWYLQLLKATGAPKASELAWKALDGAAPRIERVSVFMGLLAQENNAVDSAINDYQTVAALQRPGEGLAAAATAFRTVRGFLGQYASDDACAAFKFIRTKLDSSLPGAWTTAEREEMFTRLLQTVGKFQTAQETWKFLTGEGVFSSPNPPTDFKERLDALLSLYRLEQNNFEAARADYNCALNARRPGETVADVVAEFGAVRGRLKANGAENAREAFAFLRGDIDGTLSGAFKPEEKRRMYLKLLGAVENHGLSVKYWSRLEESGPAAEFPQRLDTFLELCSLEHLVFEEAWLAMSTLVELRAPGEKLDDALKSFAGVRAKVQRLDAAGARDAFRYVRTDLHKTLPGATDAERETMYGKLLGAVGDQSVAKTEWKHLVDASAKNPQPPIGEVVEAFARVYVLDDSIEVANKAVEAISSVARTQKQPVAALVSDYVALRKLVSPYNGFHGVSLFKFVHEQVPAPQRQIYVRLQEACLDFTVAQSLWETLNETPTDLFERTDVLVDCLKKEHRRVDVARFQLDAVLSHRHSGETITAAARALDNLRNALPLWDGLLVASAFKFVRERASATQEAMCVNLLKTTQSLEWATSVWDSVEAAGPDTQFDLRMGTLLKQPVEKWEAIVSRMKSLPKSVPKGVDADRGVRALFRLVTVDDSGALSAVLARLDATPGLDRTLAIEWLCAMMEQAGSVEAFEQGWRDVHRPGASGTVAERQLLMANLVEATRRSPGGYTSSVEILRRLDRLPAAEFMPAAQQAVALTSAMQGRAADASQALVYILDAREQGRFSTETLEDTVNRFATLYATTNSLEMALARLEQGTAPSNGGIQDKDGDLIIGGIRVPRGQKKPPPAPPSFIMKAWEELRKRFWME